MRKALFFIPIAAIIYYGCSNNPVKIIPNLLNTDSIPLQRFEIDINADTLLHTGNGSWIKIDKGTFSSGNGKVALEVKEAVTMQQIIKAGLTTQSTGQPLSSGGMIYINAAPGQNVKINKPFKVAVPSASLDKNMQLYKGEKNTEGKIDWKDPRSLEENLQVSDIKKGELLFQQKCASCHGIGKEGSGPDLAGFTKRFGIYGGEGAYPLWHMFRRQFVSSSYSTTTSNGKVVNRDTFTHYHSDPYVCNLITLFNNQEVDLSEDAFKNRENWEKIYRYIDNETSRRNLPYPRHTYLDSCADSCRLYERAKAELNKKKLLEEIKREKFIEENGLLVERKPDPTWTPTNIPPPDMDKKVRPNEYQAIYYEFTIETFGWFNVDMLLVKRDGVADSELFVRVVGATREKIKIYLIIPAAKVLGEGGPAEKDKELFAFFYKSGFIPLPQNVRAYILAVTETDDALIAYGLKEFTTQTKQQIDISLKESTKQEFDNAIESIGGDKLSITVKDSKNADSIRIADKKIKELEEGLKDVEKLKPKRCDCDCGQQMPATASTTVTEK